jgi:hypothetical protein
MSLQGFGYAILQNNKLNRFLIGVSLLITPNFGCLLEPYHDTRVLAPDALDRVGPRLGHGFHDRRRWKFYNVYYSVIVIMTALCPLNSEYWREPCQSNRIFWNELLFLR